MDNLNDQEKALYNLSTPIPLTNLMLKRPCCMICSGYIIMFIISFFVFSMGWLLPSNQTDRDYMVWGDPYVNNMDKTLLVKEALLSDTAEDEIALQSQIVTDWTAMLVY